MILESSIDTTAAALVMGLVTGLHCMGMCGPLACAVAPARGRGAAVLVAPSVYHGSRLLAYATVGAIGGGLGATALGWWQQSPVRFLPWLLVAVLLVFALGLEQRLPKPLFFSKRLWRLRLASTTWGAVKKASLLGFLTPLLPCGPLYLLFGTTVLSGSMLQGATLALAFGLGTVPLLWIAQCRWPSVEKRLTPVAIYRLRRGLALAAALILVWRLQGTVPWADPSPPPCCHG